MKKLIINRMLYLVLVWFLVGIFMTALQGCNLSNRPFVIYVSTSGNDSNTCRNKTQSCLTIQAGINKAITGSTVNVGEGTFSEMIVVNKFITIQGAGQYQTIISQPRYNNDVRPVVSIGDLGQSTELTVTLSDLTISGGQQNIRVYNHCHLIGTKLQFSNSIAQSISNDVGGRVTLSNSGFQSSSIAINNEGAFIGDHLDIGIANWGVINRGGMDMQDTTIYLRHADAALSNASGNLSFTGGTITNEGGVGLSNNDGAVATITRTMIANNRGAGIINNTGGTLTLIDGAITNNGDSGLMNGMGGEASVRSTYFSGNHRDGITSYGTITVEGVEAENNTGFGIASLDGTIHVFRSSSINNAGGIAIDRNGTVENSTFSGNTEVGVSAWGDVEISYSTIAFNELGLSVSDRPPLLFNSIIELNRYNCSETYLMNVRVQPLLSGANIVCDDSLTNNVMRLGSLTLASGTKIIPLLEGSLAIDLARGGICPRVDQRGYSRPHGSACDVGAYEFGSSLALEAVTPGIETQSATPGIFIIEPSIMPTLELFPTLTLTPLGPSMFILTKNAFCRKGPDTSFSDVTAVPAGDTVKILNVSEDGFWYFVNWDKYNQKCWIAKSTGNPEGDLSVLKVLIVPTLPPTPTPIPTKSRLPPSPIPTKSCNPLIKVCP
jgi:hypothetical protein